MTADQYLTAILEPLLKHPTDLRVKMDTDQMGVLLTLTCNREDMGVVIGKQGETAKSVRLLLRIFGLQQNARISIKINEPDGSPYRPKPRPREEDVSEALAA